MRCELEKTMAELLTNVASTAVTAPKKCCSSLLVSLHGSKSSFLRKVTIYATREKSVTFLSAIKSGPFSA